MIESKNRFLKTDQSIMIENWFLIGPSSRKLRRPSVELSDVLCWEMWKVSSLWGICSYSVITFSCKVAFTFKKCPERSKQTKRTRTANKQSAHEQTEQTNISYVPCVCGIRCIQLIPSCLLHLSKIRCNFKNISRNLWCNFRKIFKEIPWKLEKLLNIFKMYQKNLQKKNNYFWWFSDKFWNNLQEICINH